MLTSGDLSEELVEEINNFTRGKEKKAFTGLSVSDLGNDLINEMNTFFTSNNVKKTYINTKSTFLSVIEKQFVEEFGLEKFYKIRDYFYKKVRKIHNNLSSK